MANSKISALTSATTPLAGTETLPVVQSGATKQVSVANLTAGRTVGMSFLDVSGTAGKIGNINTTNANGGYWTWQTNGTSIWDIGSAKQCFNTGTANDGGLVSRAGYYFGLGANGSEILRLTTDGNATIVQAAKGINFTANSSASGMTSQLLNWYEEGNWTPVLRGSGTAGTYQTAAAIGKYTRIGRQVTLQCYLELASVITGGGTGYAQLTGMPYAKAGDTTFPVGALLTTGVDWTAGTPLVAPITSGSTSILYFPEIIDNAALNSIQISGFSAQDTLAFTLTYNAA